MMDTIEQTQIITLKSVYHKDRKIFLQPVRDIRNGWYKGVKRLSDDQKRELPYWVDPESTLIPVTHNLQLDMSDKVDALNWQWMQHSSAIAESFEKCQMSKDALFYVDNEELESRKSVDADMILAKAMGYILNDRAELLVDRARMLGYSMEADSPTTIKEVLLKMAKKPETVGKVIEVYESNEVAINLLFLKARDKNIIRQENGAFLYGTLVLGITDESVVAYLKDPLNREVALEIEKEVNPKVRIDATPKSVVKQPVKPVPVPEPVAKAIEITPEMAAPEAEAESSIEFDDELTEASEPVLAAAPAPKRAKASAKPAKKKAQLVNINNN